MDVKFSSAVHVLILISESEDAMTSEEIATSVGTNASYIRKLSGLLKKSGIIRSHKGKKGFFLNKGKDEINLLDVYKSVNEKENIEIFDIHCNPNDECVVGQHIKPVLNDLFGEINREVERQLRGKTLKNCIEDIKKKIK